MTDQATNADQETHDRQVRAIMTAVGKLWVRFGPEGFTPEAIFEGAIKGAMAQMIAATGCGPDEISKMLHEMAEFVGEIDAHRLVPN